MVMNYIKTNDGRRRVSDMKITDSGIIGIILGSDSKVLSAARSRSALQWHGGIGLACIAVLSRLLRENLFHMADWLAAGG